MLDPYLSFQIAVNDFSHNVSEEISLDQLFDSKSSDNIYKREEKKQNPCLLRFTIVGEQNH